VNQAIMCKAGIGPNVVIKSDESFTEKGIKFTHNPVSGNFKCGQCGKMLKTRFTAKIHVYSHTKEKPFSCPHCNQSFSHRSTLVNHKKIHNEPEFQCPSCLAWFARKANLKRHLRVVHKVSDENIRKSIPKAKPGPRRKQPRITRDLNFAPAANVQQIRFRDMTVPSSTSFDYFCPAPPKRVYRHQELLPPVSFAEDAVIQQATPVGRFAQQGHTPRLPPPPRQAPVPKPFPSSARSDEKPVKLCVLSDMNPGHHHTIRRVQNNHGPATISSANLTPSSSHVNLEFNDSQYIVPGFTSLPPPVEPHVDPFMDTPLFPIVHPDVNSNKESELGHNNLQAPDLSFEDLFLPWTT